MFFEDKRPARDMESDLEEEEEEADEKEVSSADSDGEEGAEGDAEEAQAHEEEDEELAKRRSAGQDHHHAHTTRLSIRVWRLMVSYLLSCPLSLGSTASVLEWSCSHILPPPSGVHPHLLPPFSPAPPPQAPLPVSVAPRGVIPLMPRSRSMWRGSRSCAS